jgi:hypothetical protein
MPTILLDAQTCQYIASFGIAAITAEADGVKVYHRPNDVPRVVDAIFWARAADAEAVAKRAKAWGGKIGASAAIAAAGRDLAVRLSPHDEFMTRVRSATQRIAGNVEAARLNGHLRRFNQEFKSRRLKATAEGKPFMSYTAALRRLRGVLATKAAARSGVAMPDSTDLMTSVFDG